MHFDWISAAAVNARAFLKKLGARRCVHLVPLLGLLAGMAWPLELRAQNALQREYEIKAAYLFNFINYVEWPAAALPPAGGTLTIGIVGDNPFSAAFEPLNGKKIKGRTLAVRPVATAKDLDGCQIVYVFAAGKPQVAEILGQLKDARVLTVSEIDGFAAQGGIINFISERNKVRFEINPDAAKRLGLSISSDLLKLARLVKS